jgi:hypothetical protein
LVELSDVDVIHNCYTLMILYDMLCKCQGAEHYLHI